MAMFCDPDKLEGIALPPARHSGVRVRLSGPGLRSGTAVGVSQALGAPLRIGQTLAVSGATHVSPRSVLFVSGQGVPVGPGLWPVPSLKVGFAAGNLAHGKAEVTIVRAGRGLGAIMRDGSGRIIRPGYVQAVVPPSGGPQVVFAYFIGLVAVEDNPRYQDCAVNVVSGRVVARPSGTSCRALQRGIDLYAKLPVTINGSTATIRPPTTYSAIQRFRKVGDRWYLVAPRD